MGLDTESAIRKTLKQRFADVGGWAMAVENGQVHPGTPDTHWCYERTSGWIELKVESLDKKFTGPQRLWAVRYTRHGGRCHLLAKQKGVFYLLSGRHAVDVTDATLSDLASVSFRKLPPGPDLLFHLLRRDNG